MEWTFRANHIFLTHFKRDQVWGEYGAHEAGTEQCTARQQCTDCTDCTVQCGSRVAGADQSQTQQHNFCFPCGGGSKQRASHCFGDWSKDWLRTVSTEAKAEEVKESDGHHGRVPHRSVLDLLALQLHHRVCRPLLQDVPRRAGGAEDRPRPWQGWLLSVGCGDDGNCDDKVGDALSQLGKQIWKLNNSDIKKVWHAYFKLLLNPPFFRYSSWIITYT